MELQRGYVRWDPRPVWPWVAYSFCRYNGRLCSLFHWVPIRVCQSEASDWLILVIQLTFLGFERTVSKIDHHDDALLLLSSACSQKYQPDEFAPRPVLRIWRCLTNGILPYLAFRGSKKPVIGWDERHGKHLDWACQIHIAWVGY